MQREYRQKGGYHVRHLAKHSDTRRKRDFNVAYRVIDKVKVVLYTISLRPRPEAEWMRDIKWESSPVIPRLHIEK